MSEAQLFTVRVWRQQAQFRATLRAVGEERSELFTEPAAVAQFLEGASADPRAAAVPCDARGPEAVAGGRP